MPKGVPLDRGRRHLAVHVEDHPLDYAAFEGVIPAGEYGGGTVEIFDRGTYSTVEEKRDGGLTVELHGARLRGVWTLVPAALDGDDRNWLLLRKDDGPVREVWRPMLATAATSPPRGRDWTFEPKWDGYRALINMRGGDVTLTSRRGGDLAGRFPDVARALPDLIRTPDCVLDAEICVLDELGRSRFERLQRGDGRHVVVVFDLLERDGVVLVAEPLSERRRALAETVDVSTGAVVLSPVFDDGEALLAVARDQGLEGLVAKRATAPYRPGSRGRDWVKVKTGGREAVTVVGWAPGDGRLSRTVGSLLVGVPAEGGLRFAGSVGSGLTDDERETLLELLRPLERESAALVETPTLPRSDRARTRWVEPRVAIEVGFSEWTSAGRLRQPVYLGRVSEELPRPSPVDRLAIPAELRRGRRELRLSNLDKPFWPDEGITKGDLLAYYRDIAPVLVPHLRGRPFTMKRHPDGWQGKQFFQKHAPSHTPDWIARAPFPASTREGDRRMIDYVLVEDDLALLWVVNMGCIETHVWSSRRDRPDRPDWVMFDLDPSADASFTQVVEVALLLRELLELLELESFPKTSGSRGLHVLVPIVRRHSHGDTREFAGIVADALARAHPRLVTTQWVKAKRSGVLVDANQNGPGKTNATVYSVRARAGAPVSTPLAWDEVGSGLDPAAFTMEVALERVRARGDLFAAVLGGGQSLTAALRAVR